MPSERIWVERTPETFVFHIKAFRLFTGHQPPPAALPADIRKALGSIDIKNIYYRDVPEDAREELWRRFRLSLAEVLVFERENGLAHVVVDEPQGFASSIPAVWEVTSPDVAVVRLHGRNRETWVKKGLTAAERFNYLRARASGVCHTYRGAGYP